MPAPDYRATIDRADRIGLVIHRSPDGDALASALALAMGLEQRKKAVTIVCRDVVPVLFNFLPAIKTINHDFLVGDYDVILTLDCGDLKRTGFGDRLREFVAKKRKPLINIDHHPKNDLHKLATINIIDQTVPATCAIVYNLFSELGLRIDYKIATCLLTGLYTDTGGFKHANTSPETFAMASELLSLGARLKDITKNLSLLTSVPRLKLWGVALTRLRRNTRLDVVSTIITQSDLAANGAEEKDIAGIAAIIASIPARASLLLVEVAPGEFQARWRTQERDVNVADLARYFGGGGQRRAAGFTIADLDLNRFIRA